MRLRSVLLTLGLSAMLVASAVPAAATGVGIGEGRGRQGVGSTIVGRLLAMNTTGRFDTIIAAATCPAFGSAVTDVLAGPGPLTLFAPTDAAFARLGLGPKAVCGLAPEPLLDILTYHLIADEVWYREALAAVGSSVTMVNGDTAEVTRRLGLVAVDGARVIQRDIRASNGLIHVVDRVLTPPTDG
ncbi:MAG: fasciclin domain-containing protein [Chloroflexota bacterium]